MQELQRIVSEAANARTAGKAAALATVVGIEGSAYRLPGARMLIVDGKWVAGSISGGCLEDDVVLRARDAISKNEAVAAVYDTTHDDDIVFGVGLGCKGIVTLLIEPLHQGGGVDFISFARTCLEQRVTGFAATIVRTEGPACAKPGMRVIMSQGVRDSDIADEALEAEIEEALGKLDEGTALVTMRSQDGSALVFLERIDPPIPLIVFGAGHDAMPVVRLAKDIGWHVTLVDHRPAYATRERFPAIDAIVLGSPKETFPKLAVDGDTIALIMTHNYLRDMDWLEAMLPSAARYVGLLGPRKRTDSLLVDLKEKGFEPTPEQLARLYAPVGLDIGSEGPAEVAMSILAEMQAVITDHGGGHLRARKVPIHQRQDASAGAAQPALREVRAARG
jgi:xanthine/CO dehydrogenase XdhC/CoxF family maturation factor